MKSRVNTRAESLRRIGLMYLRSIGFWCGLSLLTGWNYAIFDRQLNILTSLSDMLLLAEARGVALAILTPPIFYFVKRYASGIRHPAKYIAAYAAGAAPFMLLYVCIRWLVLPPWDVELQRYVPRAGHAPWDFIRTGFADQITMYFAIVAAAHAYQYFERARKQELEAFDFQRALAASELQALRMQLRPHFLFNTLHGVSTLIESDPKTARDMILKLSSLLRTALEHEGSDLVPLQEELNFIAAYLDLEKMRLGPRLKVELSIDPLTEPVLVPQLLLQPLVENAVHHGAACSREGGWIRISSSAISNERLQLRIQNSVGYERAAGTGVGLRNTEARLKYLYAGDATLNFAIDGNGIAEAILTLPVLGVHSEAA